jgi:hypothetical protein
VDGRGYHADSVFDASAPAVMAGLIGATAGPAGAQQAGQQVAEAVQASLLQGRVPLPDRMTDGPAKAEKKRLFIELGGHKLQRNGDGSYALSVEHPSGRGFDLTLRPAEAEQAVRHGAAGVGVGLDGEEMFGYSLPHCEVRGTVDLADGDGAREVDAGESAGWFERQFGGRPLDVSPQEKERQEHAKLLARVGALVEPATRERRRTLGENCGWLQLAAAGELLQVSPLYIFEHLVGENIHRYPMSLTSLE